MFLLLACPTAFAAPVPKALPLTEERLVGKWDLSVSMWNPGTIDLFADGTYALVHRGNTSVYGGVWWVSGGEMVLVEWRFCPEWRQLTGPHVYRFALDPATLTGTVGGATGRVELTNRRRPEN